MAYISYEEIGQNTPLLQATTSPGHCIEMLKSAFPSIDL